MPDRLAHGLAGLVAYSGSEVGEELAVFILRSARTKGISQEIKLRFIGKLASSFLIFAVHNAGFIRVKRQSAFPKPLVQSPNQPFRFLPCPAVDHTVSSPGESHPQALIEPDVNLSAHPAPVIQPQVKSPSASGQRAGDRVSRFFPTSALPCADGDSAFYISFEPIAPAPDSYAA